MAAHQAPPSLGFSRQEHWSGLPFPSPMHESESQSEVAQSCPTLSDPMDCSLPGSSSMGFSRQEHWSGVPVPWALTNASSSTAPGVSCYTFTSTPQISESCFQYWPLNLGKIISVDTSSLRYIRFLNGVCWIHVLNRYERMIWCRGEGKCK